MTQDCIFENTYPPPDGERFVGQDAVRTFWVIFFQNVYETHIEVVGIFGFENRCMMRWVYSWRNRLDETGHIRGIDVYTLVNHLISEKLSYVKG